MKALRPQVTGEVVVEELAPPRAKGSGSPSLARQLRVWIAFLCLAWAFLGFLAGTWFGSQNSAQPKDRPWFEDYAERLTAELGLDQGQHTRLLGYLSDYDRQERARRADYALEMELDRRELATLGNTMYRTLLDEIVVDASARERLRSKLRAQEGR